MARFGFVADISLVSVAEKPKSDVFDRPDLDQIRRVALLVTTDASGTRQEGGDRNSPTPSSALLAEYPCEARV